MQRQLLLAAGLVLAAACADQPTSAATDAQLRPGLSSAEHKGLAAARAATAGFHRFDVAHAAGYDFLFMDMCMEDTELGGMGYHYVNTALLDASLDVSQPEAVMYEPGSNGQLRLVGLEYVIPAAAWTSSEPPELLGQQLTLNGFGLWALHVWIWKNNPSGIYADWNPTVACDNASAGRTGGHR
jgi:hypothetical protein